MIQVGDRVLWQDPKMTKERAGRTPRKRPLMGPGSVTRVDNRRCEIRTDDGLILKDDHLVVIPRDVDDWEREALELRSDPEAFPRSLGQMTADAGRATRARPELARRTALQGLAPGRVRLR